MYFSQKTSFKFLFIWRGTILTGSKMSVKMELPRGRWVPLIPDRYGFFGAANANAAGFKYTVEELTSVKEAEDRMRKKAKYTSELPRQLYTFFISQSTEGAPSFDKFARSIGATLEDVELFRQHDEFNRAYRECSEIRRDYLIDAALARRYDPSFVKFLLSAEFGMGEKEKEKEDTGLTVTLKVLEDNVDKA